MQENSFATSLFQKRDRITLISHTHGLRLELSGEPSYLELSNS